MKFYYVAHKFLAVLIRMIFRLKVVGTDNEPLNGSLLVCGNHISMWDPVLIAASMKKRQVRYMAKAELFKIPFVSFLIKSLGAFPVQRGSGDIRAIKITIQHLLNGDCVGIFPQGSRHREVDPRATEIKSGTGMVAFHGKCDVLPIAVVNKKRKMSLFTKTYIVIGKPIKYEELGFTDGNKEQFQRASQIIFDRICDLHDEYFSKL